MSTFVRAVKACGELRVERRGAAEHQPDRAEPVLEAGHLHPVGEHGRRHRQHGDRLVLDEVERPLGVEAVDEHEPGALAEHLPEDGVEAVDVEERQHPEHHVRPVIIGGSTSATCSMLASSARCESIAARGRPEVPLV